MSEKDLKALRNAMASSSMEGLPINEEELNIILRIMNGEMSLQYYLESAGAKQTLNSVEY